MFYRIILIIFILSTPLIGYAQDDRLRTTGEFEFNTTSAEILGEEYAVNYEEVLAPDEDIKWTVHVPENYDPAYPPGLIVHITERNLAILPFGWNTALKEKNLIWISLNKTGRITPNKEMLLSVLSTAFIDTKYPINTDRIYISSIMESCISASAAMQFYPTIFKGVIYTSCLPINWKNDIPNTIEEMKNNRYVFISGSDNNLEREMRRMVRKYENSGLEKIQYMNIPQLAYGKNLNRRRLIEFIEFLDTRD